MQYNTNDELKLSTAASWGIQQAFTKTWKAPLFLWSPQSQARLGIATLFLCHACIKRYVLDLLFALSLSLSLRDWSKHMHPPPHETKSSYTQHSLIHSSILTPRKQRLANCTCFVTNSLADLFWPVQDAKFNCRIKWPFCFFSPLCQQNIRQSGKKELMKDRKQ
jgi:hypothetical protein